MQITLEKLRRLAPRGKADILRDLVGPLNAYLPRYGISKPMRVAHFLAQAAHEADGFKTLQEYASGEDYEGREKLGNTQPGDGKRFKGRGIFQLTGRANYVAYGKKLGLNLVDNPKLAASPEVSVRVACEYWQAKGLNALADKDDIKRITKRINGGYNGLADRQRYLAAAKRLFLEEMNEPKPPPQPSPPDDPGPQPEPDPDPQPEKRKKTWITETGSGLSLGTAADAVTTAKDVINTVNDTKDTAADLGVMDYVIALATNWRFMIPFVLLVALVAGVAWWQIRKRR